MANNRTEAKTAVSTALVPTLTLAQHITLLNDEINESTIFRKDVIASETEAGGNVTIDYSNKDTATVTTAVNLAVSFTNVENGDVKYLVITKAATNTLTFAGAIDITEFIKVVDNDLTSVPYQVFNKNGVIYVQALVRTIIEGLLADITASDPRKFTTCKAVKDAISALDTSDVTTGVFALARIPDLPASKTTSGTFAAARIPEIVATESTVGGLEISSTAEAQALTADDKIITPAKLADVNGGLLTKIVNIGDWDMDATATVSVAHGLTLGNIRKISVWIRNDTGGTDLFYPLDFPSNSGVGQGNYFLGTVNIVLTRLAAGQFDSTIYDSTSFNRGWMVIDYVN